MARCVKTSSRAFALRNLFSPVELRACACGWAQGKMLRFVTAGESHGQALVAWISGFPAGFLIDLYFVGRELHRRQLGYGRGGRQKIEKDAADIFAGVRHGKTIGAPIALRVENRDWANWEKILPVGASDAPETLSRKLTAPRPGHAD